MRKAAYKTSEFWFTLVSFIISGLFLSGIITDHSNKDELISVVTHAVESIILIGGQVGILSRYLSKRRAENIEYEKSRQIEHDAVRKELEDYVGVNKIHNEIQINSASLGELIQLPHIGTTTAQKIIDHRNTTPFKSVFELTKISGIGQSIFLDIAPYIKLWGIQMSDLSPKELIKKEVLVIADEVKSSLKDIKKFALLEAWKILQMLVAIVVQIIEDTAKDLSGPEKKKIAIESIEAFYDKVFAHVDVPGIPGYLEPVLHSYIKKLMMIFVSASIDAMVATFRRVGVFTQKYIDKQSNNNKIVDDISRIVRQ